VPFLSCEGALRPSTRVLSCVFILSTFFQQISISSSLCGCVSPSSKTVSPRKSLPNFFPDLVPFLDSLFKNDLHAVYDTFFFSGDGNLLSFLLSGLQPEWDSRTSLRSAFVWVVSFLPLSLARFWNVSQGGRDLTIPDAYRGPFELVQAGRYLYLRLILPMSSPSLPSSAFRTLDSLQHAVSLKADLSARPLF